MIQGELLRNHSAERKTHNVNGLQTQCPTESNAMWRHFRDAMRRFFPGSSYTCVIKQNDLAISRESVRDFRIPSIHVGVEVSEQEEWNRAWPAEAPVRVPHAVGFHELCRDCFMRVFAHSLFFHWSPLYRGHWSIPSLLLRRLALRPIGSPPRGKISLPSMQLMGTAIISSA